MTIPNGHTKLLGLIGSTIKGSYSYLLHNRTLDHMGLNAVYLPFQSAQSNWDSIFELDHFVGANVTMPYKEDLLRRMDILTDRAQTIGAINTIHKLGGQLIGDNTDSVGFLSALKDQQIPWTDRPIYILGAGGAAKSICYALNSVGVDQVHIWNRNAKRIQNLHGLLPQIHSWDGITALPETAIIVQCTPLGQQGEDPLSKHSLHPDQIVLDLIYQQTPLIQRMRALGGIAIDGGGMLIHQAAHSFARWFDCPPPIEIMTNTFANTSITESPL